MLYSHYIVLHCYTRIEVSLYCHNIMSCCCHFDEKIMIIIRLPCRVPVKPVNGSNCTY